MLPVAQRQVRWELEGGEVPELSAHLADATRDQALSVRVPSDLVARVRCVVRDATPWVRGAQLSTTLPADATAKSSAKVAGLADGLPGS